jgi:membrane-associated phospholipid phosphatase
VRIDAPAGWRARLDPDQRYGLRLTLVAIAVLIVAVPFAGLTFEVMGDGPSTRWDSGAAQRLNGWVDDRPRVVTILQLVSWLGRPPLLAVLVVAVSVWCLRNGRHRLVAFLVATSLGGGIVDTIVKELVDRPRPVVANPVTTAIGKSFPSGHAMSSTVTFGALLVVLLPLLSPPARRVAFAAYVALVAAIGGSRLFLGVHYVTDVIGGYLLGVAWLVGAVAAFQAWSHDVHPRRGRRAEHELDELAADAEAVEHPTAVP